MVLMRRRSNGMWLGALPQCIVMWSARDSRSESLWTTFRCETQAGFLILLAFLCVSFCFISSSLWYFLYRPTYWPLCNCFSSYPCALYPEDGIVRLLYFSIWFIWRAYWLSGVLPGSFHGTVCSRIWNRWGYLRGWVTEESFQGKRSHGYLWELVFITYISVSKFICIHLATSLCICADEDVPVSVGL